MAARREAASHGTPTAPVSITLAIPGLGAALTQHPELYRAVVSYAGLYDMLRVELHPIGAFNAMEYGTVRDVDQFRALYAYSPYHHVVDGTEYPAVLFVTGDNDTRVDPANSRKMTARLQASGAKRPVLLRTRSPSEKYPTQLRSSLNVSRKVSGKIQQRLESV
jgi:prolyl oligopeptidase